MDHAASTSPGVFLRSRSYLYIVFPQAVTNSLNILMAFLIDSGRNKGSLTGSSEDLVKLG